MPKCALDASIRELREAQAHTDQKLNALIDTVDSIIRSRNEMAAGSKQDLERLF